MQSRLTIYSCLAFAISFALLQLAYAQNPSPARQKFAKLVDIGPTGIDIKKPVFAGATPGYVGLYQVNFVVPPIPSGTPACVEPPQFPAGQNVVESNLTVSIGGAFSFDNAVPDISATSEINLTEAWNGEGAYAPDHKKRQNYRIIAAIQQPNFLMLAANKKSGITDLSQVKTRTQPTWIAFTNRDKPVDEVLEYYGISEEGLKTKGGGFIRTSDRLKRAAADVFIGGAVLADTPEQRMWYEVTQLNDLIFFDIPEPLLARLAEQRGYQRATAPIAFLRGAERPIPTVMRSTHVIYVRDDAPDNFTYTLAKALDEHQELFRLYGDPWYYDTRFVAKSTVIPLAPGAARYYRERGYLK